MEHTEFSILLLNGCAKHRSWASLNVWTEVAGAPCSLGWHQYPFGLWALDMWIWAKSFQIPPCVVSSLRFLLFHLRWLQNWFILFSAGLFFCLWALSLLLLPAPSWLFLVLSLGSPCGRGGGTSPTAEQLNSQKSREVVCVSQRPCEIPKGDFHAPSSGLFLSWTCRKSLSFNKVWYSWCAVDMLPPGGVLQQLGPSFSGHCWIIGTRS